jgi:hypothetical protein
MPDDRRKTYPMMATTHWWSLRKRFRGAIPREVTPTYLASALGMNENSAKTNIMPSLRATSIVDKEGKPTDRAVRWRDDAQYAAVCEEIRTTTYPQELLDLAPDASAGRQVIQSWFANHTGAGESGAQKMTSFYVMLLEADPNKQSDAGNGGTAAKSPTRAARPTTAKAARRAQATLQPTQQDSAASDAGSTQAAEQPPRRKQPDLHINVQIHISSEASAEQVEQIFASMAKHLKELA